MPPPPAASAAALPRPATRWGPRSGASARCSPPTARPHPTRSRTQRAPANAHPHSTDHIPRHALVRPARPARRAQVLDPAHRGRATRPIAVRVSGPRGAASRPTAVLRLSGPTAMWRPGVGTRLGRASRIALSDPLASVARRTRTTPCRTKTRPPITKGTRDRDPPRREHSPTTDPPAAGTHQTQDSPHPGLTTQGRTRPGTPRSGRPQGPIIDSTPASRGTADELCSSSWLHATTLVPQ